MAERKRNHYLPELMLRRFQSRSKGKKHWIWQFHRERPPTEASTKDVAVGQYFYGKPEDGVEDALWRQEKAIAPLLDSVETRGVRPEDKPLLRFFLWTLAIRTKAIRSQFESVGQELLRSVRDTIDSPPARAYFAQRLDRDVDAILDGELEFLPENARGRARKAMESPEVRAALRAYARAWLERTELTPTMEHLMALFQAGGRMEEAAQKGQVGGLSKLLQQPEPPAGFGPTEWSILHARSMPFILGDSGVVAVGPRNEIGTLLRFSKEWAECYVAISPNTLLVARMSPGDPSLHPDDFNEASAGLSSEHFFASRSTATETSLVPSIGSLTAALSDQEIADIVANAWTRPDRAGG